MAPLRPPAVVRTIELVAAQMGLELTSEAGVAEVQEHANAGRQQSSRIVGCSGSTLPLICGRLASMNTWRALASITAWKP